VDSLPTEIEQAALVDGCTEFQVLRYITMPLMMPGMITTAVFAFIMAWNEFLYALVLTRDNATTMTVGLLSTQTHRGVQWEWMAAGGILVMIPIFILSLTIRHYFVEGLTMGAVK
jgi:multiple sugar transport system permease protein